MPETVTCPRCKSECVHTLAALAQQPAPEELRREIATLLRDGYDSSIERNGGWFHAADAVIAAHIAPLLARIRELEGQLAMHNRLLDPANIEEWVAWDWQEFLRNHPGFDPTPNNVKATTDDMNRYCWEGTLRAFNARIAELEAGQRDAQ